VKKLLVVTAAIALMATAAGAQVTPPPPPTRADTGRKVPPPAVPLPDSARPVPVSPPSVVPLPDSTAVVRADTAPTVAARRAIRVCAGGDVTLGTNLDTTWAKNARRRLRAERGLADDPDTLLAPLRPLFAGADLVLLNVEGAIGEGPSPSKCGRQSRNCYAFRQPVAAARALRAVAESAVVVGNVANNHSRDAGPRGFTVTRRHLARAGVFVVGADTLATAVALPSGDTVGVLGFYTSSETPDVRDLAAVRRHVSRAVERYGTVIVTMHLGAEGASAQRTRDTTEIFLGSIDRGNPVAFADAAIESGATMVIGHGPHVLRAGEWRGGRLVLYSLGNLLTYGPFGLAEPMNRGVVACATIDSAGAVSAGELRSTMQLAPGVLVSDPTRRAAHLIDSLSILDFPNSGVVVDSLGRLGRRAVVEAVKPDPGRRAPVLPDSVRSSPALPDPGRSAPAVPAKPRSRTVRSP
jgi:hypothetical protein